MVQTPTKRQASRSPEGARPTKRALTSSPEEGEVDDGTLPLNPNLPPRPPSPTRLAARPKVAYPFKKKADGLSNGVLGSEKALPVVYERSEEDERRIREADMKRKSHRGIQGDARRRGASSIAGDHWEPTMGYSRDHAAPQRGTMRDAGHYHGDVYHPVYNSRDRDRSARDRRSDWDHSASFSRGTHHRRDWDKASLSPPSPNRSRTPSPHSPQHREKHRLPPPRSPEPSFSPSRRTYGAGRTRDRDRQRDRTTDRDWDGRYHGEKDEQSYSWRAREPHVHYQRGSLDEHDRYWRPDQSANARHDYARDGRSRPRNDVVDPDHRSRSVDEDEPGQEHERDGEKEFDHSPHEPPITACPSTPPQQSPLLGPHTPPPPSITPPPPPYEPVKDQMLPTEHATVSIALPMKRPGAPKDIHSPPSLRLPVAEDLDGKAQRDGMKTPETNKGGVQKGLDNSQGKAMPVVRKRIPVKRSPKEEEAAYGRMFKGCGRQKDYEITTKLGEGTFGYV
jgi:hypothetical protein